MSEAYEGRRRSGQVRDAGSYSPQHAAGITPAPVMITDSLSVVGGLYRHRSASTGALWWSHDGNYWHGSPEAARGSRRRTLTGAA